MDNSIRKAIKNDFNQFPYKMINEFDIHKMGFKWFSRDKIPSFIRNGCYILNLDDHNGNGTHWTLFIVNDKYLFYDDSVGTLLMGYPPKELHDLANRMNIKVITNPYTYQHVSSNLCGYYALYMATIFKKYINILNPQNFKKIIYNEFGDSPDKFDVQKVIEWSHLNNLI
jgi:hypothetical protein